jgi:hypothetical protein
MRRLRIRLVRFARIGSCWVGGIRPELSVKQQVRLISAPMAWKACWACYRWSGRHLSWLVVHLQLLLWLDVFLSGRISGG